MTGKTFGLLFLLARLASSEPARAQSAPDEELPGAEALFEQGLAEMRQGHYDVACPHLAESYRLDPLPGALFTLAECEVSWNKPATALEHYQSFLSALTRLPAARRDSFEERRAIAAGQVTVLGVSAPELTINIAPGLPPTLVVKADGASIPAGTYGVARRVDPGSYHLTAELAGKQIWERQLELHTGDRASVEVEPRRARAAPAAAARPHASAPPAPRTESLNPIVFVAGGVALAGLATGVVGGLLAYGKKATIDDHCAAHVCDVQGRAALNTARAEARVSTVGFSFAGAGVALAALVLLLPDSGTRSSATAVAPAKRTWTLSGDTHRLQLECAF